LAGSLEKINGAQDLCVQLYDLLASHLSCETFWHEISVIRETLADLQHFQLELLRVIEDEYEDSASRGVLLVFEEV